MRACILPAKKNETATRGRSSQGRYSIQIPQSEPAGESRVRLSSVGPLRDPLRAPKGTPCSIPPRPNFSTKNHHKTMKFEDSEAEILRTPIKIEKLSLWNKSGSEFVMNLEFHGFLREKNTPSQSGLVQSSLVCMVFHAVQSVQSCPIRSRLWSGSSLVWSIRVQVWPPIQVQGLVQSSLVCIVCRAVQSVQ